jgi:DNA polymerase III epsilon subunit-like protein
MIENLVSVDIEAAGPIPGKYSMLSIGACLVDDPGNTLYIELQPINENVVPEALAVSKLSLEQLSREGSPPTQAMKHFAEWLSKLEKPVFVGFNATFDWSFVNYYFIEYSDRNPFGIGGIDIKAYAMGKLHCSWDETRSSRLAERLGISHENSHHALEDAQFQAKLFRLLQAA